MCALPLPQVVAELPPAPTPAHDVGFVVKPAMASSSSRRRLTADEERTPRFSNMCTSILGSPFLTTSDLPSESDAPRSSPSASTSYTLPYSNLEMEAVDGADVSVPRSLTVTRPPSPSPSFRTETYSIINWNADRYPFPSLENTPRCGTSGRRTVTGYYSWASAEGGGASPMKPSRSLTLGFIPRIWDAIREGSPARKGKRRACLPSASTWRDGIVTDTEYIDYMNMPPLDGEEGELIDDEACFIDATRITGTGECASHGPVMPAVHRCSPLAASPRLPPHSLFGHVPGTQATCLMICLSLRRGVLLSPCPSFHVPIHSSQRCLFTPEFFIN